jgi:hypothetical protein
LPAFDFNGLNIPLITPLDQGGFVSKTGIAQVHRGEVWSGVKRDFGPYGDKSGKRINVSIDRRRWVQQTEYETVYGGV